MTKAVRTRDRAARASEQAPAADESPLRLSPERAFVVQLQAGGYADRLEGRVEHLTTGEAGRFRSTAELARFMTRFLRTRGHRSEGIG